MKSILFCALLVVVGCSSDPSDNGLTWSRESDGATVVGKDSHGDVQARFERVVQTDADGTVHGAIQTTVEGSNSTMEFVIDTGGRGRVLRNEILRNPRIIELARDARASLNRADASDATLVRSLAPRDLVTPGGLLETSPSCLVHAVAVACIIGAMCGIGGEQRLEVLDATIGAGVETCQNEPK